MLVLGPPGLRRREGSALVLACCAFSFLVVVAALVVDAGLLHAKAALAGVVADIGSSAAALAAEPAYSQEPYTWVDEDGVEHTVFRRALAGLAIDPEEGRQMCFEAVGRFVSAYNSQVGREELKLTQDESLLDGVNYTLFCGISFPEPSRAVVTARVRLPGMFPGLWAVGSAVRHADAVPVWRAAP